MKFRQLNTGILLDVKAESNIALFINSPYYEAVEEEAAKPATTKKATRAKAEKSASK